MFSLQFSARSSTFYLLLGWHLNSTLFHHLTDIMTPQTKISGRNFRLITGTSNKYLWVWKFGCTAWVCNNDSSTLIRVMLAPHVAVWSISVLLNQCGLGCRVWWSSWPSVGTFSAAGDSDWMALMHVSGHRHFWESRPDLSTPASCCVRVCVCICVRASSCLCTKKVHWCLLHV